MKGKSILEVSFVFLVFSVFTRWFVFFLRSTELDTFWSNLLLGAVLFLTPLSLIWLTKTQVAFQNWKLGVHIGYAILWLGIIQSMGFAFAAMMGGEGFSSLPAILILIISVCCMIALALWLFTRIGDFTAASIKWKLTVLGSFLLLPPIVVIITQKPLLSTLGWELYFLTAIGFGEEAFYRGYIQTRVNNELGRPWKFWGLEYGLGLLLASFLFGISHLYQFGSLQPNWALAVGAIFAGLFFGIVREKGGLWASFIFHAWWSAVPESIMIVFGVM